MGFTFMPINAVSHADVVQCLSLSRNFDDGWI
jgi:hypothetical protein